MGGHLSPRLMGSPPGRAMARRCAARRGSGAAAARVRRGSGGRAQRRRAAAEGVRAWGYSAERAQGCITLSFRRPAARAPRRARCRAVLAP